SPARPVRLPLRLAIAQVAVFALMEIIERLAAGAPIATLFNERVFAVGVVAQIVVAVLVAHVVLWLGHAAAALARCLGPTTFPARRRAQRWATRNAGPSTSRPRTALAIRGPAAMWSSV